MDWGLYAWISRGSRRKSVISLLANSNKPLSTKDIGKSESIAISQTSFTLKELLAKNLIECINPRDNIGKLYKITKKGRSYLKNVKK